MDVIKVIRDVFKRKKIFIYSMLLFFLLFSILSQRLPKHISVYENSTAHVGVGIAEEENTAVIENSAVPVKDNIEIDIVKGADIVSADSGIYNAKYTFLGIPVKNVNLNVVPQKDLIVCGNISGEVIETKGVLVLGTGKIKDSEGNNVSPCSGILKSGDSVLSIDGTTVSTKEEFTDIVSQSGGKSLKLGILRDGENISADITPVMSGDNDGYKIGCWVRDDTQGLGTLTFVNPENNTFGALGHGIYDVDTNTLMSTSGGVITASEVTGVKKGEKGAPGEVSGSLNKDRVFGSILSNTDEGIYGIITSVSLCPSLNSEPMETAISKDVHTGKAYIKSDIMGKPELYEIEIENINRLDITSDKSMTVKITDERLLSATGGIIQGMSGSPIIQDNKLIGALTHVFVNNPQKGYGIFIDNMLLESDKAMENK